MMRPPVAFPIREAHAHVASLGQTLAMPDLSSCLSVGECLELVRRESARLGEREPSWLRLHGARIEAWSDRRWPTRHELDAAAGARPCVMLSFDLHSGVANSAAMAGAGVRSQADAPAGGTVGLDRLGAPSGLLLEGAFWKVWSAAPEPGPVVRRRHVAAALRVLADLGYVEVHDLLSQAWLGPMLAEMDCAGELPLRVRLYPPLSEFEAAVAGSAGWERPRVVLSGAKVFHDGTLNSRSAWVLEPYRDPLPGEPNGRRLLTSHELDQAIERTRAAGLGLAVHAIGDAAVRAALDAWERHRVRRVRAGAFEESPGALRIEHAELIDGADVPRFAGLGVVCSAQPCHLLADVEALRRALPHRLDRVLPLRELIDSGCRPGELLWFGSDAPVVRADPGDSIRAATARRREGAACADAIAPEQSISEGEAWSCFRCAREVNNRA
ncbi:MAG: amidohydrolase family protein [Phycisphaerae bacterium]|nr:amidohydrolase family protein [Phycisphaerae bacterium]